MILVGIVIGGLLLVILESRHQTITATLSSAPPAAVPPIVVPPGVSYPQMMVGSTAVDRWKRRGPGQRDPRRVYRGDGEEDDGRHT